MRLARAHRSGDAAGAPAAGAPVVDGLAAELECVRRKPADHCSVALCGVKTATQANCLANPNEQGSSHLRAVPWLGSQARTSQANFRQERKWRAHLACSVPRQSAVYACFKPYVFEAPLGAQMSPGLLHFRPSVPYPSLLCASPNASSQLCRSKLHGLPESCG
jgi:hypothetical protein